MSKVLFYCHTFYPKSSGFSNAFVNLVKAISRYKPDIHIDVITSQELGTYDELRLANVNIIRIKYPFKIKFLRFFLNRIFIASELKKKFFSADYSMLFIETLCDSLLISFFSKRLLRKTVVRLHSTDDTEGSTFFPHLTYRLRRKIFNKLAVKKLKFIASTNRYHLRFYKKYFLNNNVYEIAKRTFFVIPNTIDCKDFVCKQKSFEKDSKLKFLMIGKLYKEGYIQKGHQDIINALALLGAQKLQGRINLTIIGQGKYREHLINSAKYNQLDFINFVESLDHLQVLNHLCYNDVVILPSRFEGLSMFALEALATGNAVLFSNVGGLSDLVDENGYLFGVQNIEDLADKIQRFIELDRKDIERMKQKSIELFHKRFDEKIVAEKFEKVLSIVKTEGAVFE